MNVKAQLKADEAREGMRVTYGIDVATRKAGTLTGETRVTSGVTRFKVRPIDGGRAVWVVYVWAADDAPAIVPEPAELADPRVVPVAETFSTGANFFDPSLTLYADGTRVVVRGVSQLASDMWDGRTGVTVGRLPAFPYGFQAVRWDDSGKVDNVAPHVLHELPAPVAPLAPGDRVEVGGRVRVVTSVVPSRYRGRKTLYVAHAAPGGLPHESDVTTVPVPLESTSCDFLSPRALAAHVLTSAAHTLRPAGVIIPETPASARREYVEARERGEGVSLALTRARLEVVAHTVLTPARDFSGWTIDAAELERVTRSPELDALSGTVRDADGQRLLFPIDVPDGIRLTVTHERDNDGVADEECYSPEDVEAWGNDEWEFRTVVVTARNANLSAHATASLGGVGIGDHWPGGDAAQLWHAVPDLVREVLADLPDDDDDGDATCGQCGDDRTAVQGEHHGRTVWLCERHAVTCGTCGHIYSDTTPAGRCPREADHERTCSRCEDVVGYLSSRDLCDGCEAEPDDGLSDVDRELVSQHEDMTRRIDRARAILGNASGHYAPRDQRSLDALAALDGRDL